MPTLPFTHIHPDIPSSALIWVEGGNFAMGSNEYKAEKPIHPVKVPSFAIGQYPVTQELWAAVMGENPSAFIDPLRPVESVSWLNTQAFFKKINQDQRLQRGQGYRLPSEAEWEYVARRGTQSGGFEYAGGDKLDELGWYDENSHGRTQAVGLKLANELDIHDLSGNVWEWCQDHWHDDYQGAPSDGSAWEDNAGGAARVLRGGSWYYNPHNCRSASRSSNHPTFRTYVVGFRVVLFFPPGS
jgi:formylglycine-generating enzyme required for sulfatase activity